MLKPEIDVTDDGALEMTIIFGYPNAFQSFFSSIPESDDVHNYRDAVQKFENLKGVDAQTYFNSFLSSVNVSGSIPTVGACISVDTTFSLSSSEFVTIAIGIADNFVTKASKKNSSIILAVMIHSVKTKENHQKFSNFLNAQLSKIDPQKKKFLGTILVDGEESFACYAQGTYLSGAILLRCDRHRLDNLRLVCANQMEYDYLQKALYGEKQETVTGYRLKEAVLQVLNKSSFTDRFLKLLGMPSLSDNAKKWLLSNCDSLYLKNSLIRKLEGGWPVQYLTTNIIESKNAYLKNVITSKKPGHLLLDDFLFIHRNEINDRLNAMLGKESILDCIEKRSALEWSKMNILQRKNFLRLGGLDFIHMNESFDQLPGWIIENITNINSYVEALENLKYSSTSEENIFYVFCKKKQESTQVVINGSEINCTHKICSNASVKEPICIHRMKVLLMIPKENQAKFIEKLSLDRTGVTYMNLMHDQMKPQDGTKYSTKRKGKTFSSHNRSRALESLVSAFDQSVTLG